MKRILVGLMILVSFGAVSLQAGPAPMAKQLRIGAIGSGDNSVDVSSNNYVALRWMAQRYGYWTSDQFPTTGVSWIARGLNRAEVDTMKAWNPNIKITKYDIHARQAWDVIDGGGNWTHDKSDTADIRNYATAIGKPIESLLIIANGAVTINNRACPGYTYCGNLTTNANGIVKFINFESNQTRIMFDPRSKSYGYYLAHIYDSACNALHIDGIFGDEYGSVGYTGVYNCDECTMSTMFPLREPNYWVSGAGNLKNFPGFTATTTDVYRYRDSLAKWDTLNWFWALTDSFAIKKGRVYFMNTSATGGGLPGYPARWTNEIMPMVRLARSSGEGEYTYNYPGLGDRYNNCRRFQQQMVDVRDFAREMLWGWIRLGQIDASEGKPLDRSQMTALGLMLEIEVLNKSAINPYGKVDNYYLPCVKNGQTDYYFGPGQRGLFYGYDWADSLSLWNYAWGKYFGDPSGSIDTSFVGTDPIHGSRRVDKAVFYRPGTSTVLTMSIGRFANGMSSYDTNATGIDYTLPTGTWYPLISTRMSNPPVHWGAPLSGGSVIKVGNGHFQIFSSDTVLSNAGPADTLVSISGSSASEPGTLNLTVTVNKVLASNITFRVNYANVTAISGVDYSVVQNQLYTITAGSLSVTVPVTILRNTAYTGNRTFTATISSLNQGTIGTATATGTIVDIDPPPSTYITIDTLSGNVDLSGNVEM